MSKSVHEATKLPGNASISCLITWLGQRGDYSEKPVPELRGLSKYFNSYTQRGRVNTVIATYVVVAGMGIAYWIKKKQQSR